MNGEMAVIDLRSDTVTQPTPGMREAMARAPVGDDVYGEDPTVNAVEARVAELAGKEAGLLVPSGTQGNLVSLLAHCQRGDEYIVGQRYHTYWYEAGGGAVLGSIQPQPIPVGRDGTLALEDIAGVIKPPDSHFARSRLLALENTHAGRALPSTFLQAASDLAHEHGLAVHLDGARLFNAAIATDRPVSELANGADSISLCFSKGLGTPIGSVVVGSAQWIASARRWRKMVGGGMRQAGIIAAAIDYALDHHVESLAEDHRRARVLAAGLEAVVGADNVYASTNMVHLDVGDATTGDELRAALWSEGIRIAGGRRVRLVTHLDIDDAAIDHAVERIRAHLPQARSC